MVERSDLEHAAELQRESQDIQRALRIIDMAGSAITAVTFEAPWQPPPPPPLDEPMLPVDLGPNTVTVPTIGLAYPPQMITSIKQQLQTRYDEILSELAGIGVTTISR